MLGSNISLYRNRAGLTQEKLAEKLEVSFQTISNWERGENLPDVLHLKKMAKALNVTADDLLNDSTDTAASMRHRFFDENHMYTYVKTVAQENKLLQTLAALPYAKAKHDGVFRKNRFDDEKVPYIYHPLIMACQALAFGIRDDDVLAAILLHDVYEDCGVQLSDLPVGDHVREVVRLLSHNAYPGTDEESDPVYYAAIAQEPTAALVKCIDRCQNLSSMADGFSREKIRSYIAGTEKYVVPIAENLSKLAPQYSNAAWLLRYQISALLEMAKRLV